MTSATRKFIAVVAACGLSASVIAYIGSYAGTTVDGLSLLAAALHIGAILFMLPMIAIEYPEVRDRKYFWKGFSEGMPAWVIPGIKLLELFFLFHFVLFLIQSHAASPQIINGEHVLSSRGHIMRGITQEEYFRLKGGELRLFATLGMCFYFIPTVYWWFPRNRERPAERPAT